ncbi:MAG TPA: hypothetical protein VKB80_28945 [Kofleriaceae bacterium]|nr:hypothetical protein [Kofleriaceae bacterium]
MISERARGPALALVMVALASGCGGDDDTSDDGGEADASADAGSDAGAPDSGDDLCPGMSLFEALTADAESAASIFEVDVAEVGGSASTTSAPNGRADLCLPAGADAQVRSTKDGYLARLDTLSADALDILDTAVNPYPLDLLETAAADGLLFELGTPPRDEAATLLLVSVVTADGAPLARATVSIDRGDDGVFARQATGDFVDAGDPGEVADGRVLLFVNVAVSGADDQVAITVTPPGDFGGACVGPPSATLEAGGLSGALFVCQ